MSKLLTEVILNTVEQEVEVIARGRTNLDMQTAVLNASIASADSGIAGATSTNANISPMGSAAMMTTADELLTSLIKHHGPTLEDAVANFVGHAVQNEASQHQQDQLRAKRQAQINTNPNEHIQTTNSFNAKTIDQRISAQNDDTYEQSKRSTGGARTITDNSNPNSQVSSADYQLDTTATRQAQQVQQQANTQNRFASSQGNISPAWQSSLASDIKVAINTQTQDVNPYATSSIANQAPLNALSGTAGLSLPAASVGNNRVGFFASGNRVWRDTVAAGSGALNAVKDIALHPINTVESIATGISKFVEIGAHMQANGGAIAFGGSDARKLAFADNQRISDKITQKATDTYATWQHADEEGKARIIGYILGTVATPGLEFKGLQLLSWPFREGIIVPSESASMMGRFDAQRGSTGINQKTLGVAPSELKPTEDLSRSRNQFRKFLDEVKKNGITEPIKYVEYNGDKYVVDGHHRLMAAKILNFGTVPVEKVELPYKSYKSEKDLYYFP